MTNGSKEIRSYTSSSSFSRAPSSFGSESPTTVRQSPMTVPTTDPMTGATHVAALSMHFPLSPCEQRPAELSDRIALKKLFVDAPTSCELRCVFPPRSIDRGRYHANPSPLGSSRPATAAHEEKEYNNSPKSQKRCKTSFKRNVTAVPHPDNNNTEHNRLELHYAAVMRHGLSDLPVRPTVDALLAQMRPLVVRHIRRGPKHFNTPPN